MTVSAPDGEPRRRPRHARVLHARRLRVADARHDEDIRHELAAHVGQGGDLTGRDRVGLLGPAHIRELLTGRHDDVDVDGGDGELGVDDRNVADAEHELPDDARRVPLRVHADLVGARIEQRYAVRAARAGDRGSRRAAFGGRDGHRRAGQDRAGLIGHDPGQRRGRHIGLGPCFLGGGERHQEQRECPTHVEPATASTAATVSMLRATPWGCGNRSVRRARRRPSFVPAAGPFGGTGGGVSRLH